MSGGPYSPGRRHAALTLFARIALVAGPLVLLFGVLMWAGIAPGGSSGGDDPVDVTGSAAAGGSLQVSAVQDPQTLWGSPADVDVSAVSCTTRDGKELELDAGPVRTDGDDAEWVRLGVVENELTQVMCSGGGLEQVAVADAGSAGGTRGGVFFVVWGVIITAAGLLARRLTRR